MAMGSTEARLAILLTSLGDEFTEGVLQKVPGERAKTLQVEVDRFRASPPDGEVVAEVLGEFNRFFDFALANSDTILENQETEEDDGLPPVFESTGDPIADLDQLQDYQIAGALRNETGLTISVILRQLSPRRVGEVMRHLPDEVKEDAFLRLQAPSNMPKPLVTKIAKSIVSRASLLDPSAASDPTHLADEKTAGLLRSMDRQTRGLLMQALEGKDSEMAERVKQLLFRFEDLLRITDKSIQNLLKQVDNADLAPALKNADQEIADRIANNLSKQARATLFEEIEFLEPVSAEMEEQVRKNICNVISQMDSAGELEMMEE